LLLLMTTPNKFVILQEQILTCHGIVENLHINI
jgi:hypothetical protein